MFFVVGALPCLLMVVVTPLGGAQRTYQRHCDCEYWLDGKCAYTLLLPTTSSGDMSCPRANASESVSRLQDDVSSLQTWTGEQAKAVVTLQNSINALTAAVLRLETTDGARPTHDASNSSQSAAVLDDVKAAVDQLNRTVVRLTQLCRGRCSDETNTTTVALERQLVSKYRLCVLRGLIVNTINDSAIAASSVNESLSASDVRINSTSDDNNSGGWCPSQSTVEEWIQFDLGHARAVYAIVTRGRDMSRDWVTAYKMMFSTDLSVWTTYTDVTGSDLVFTGNSDDATVKVNDLWQSVSARYIRLLPSFWHGNAACMRADLVGCLDQLET